MKKARPPGETGLAGNRRDLAAESVSWHIVHPPFMHVKRKERRQRNSQRLACGDHNPYRWPVFRNQRPAVDFRIADTFTASLTRLTGVEQKAVKTSAFDLQLDPSAPGLSFHKLDRAKDPHFWSVRVNADLRLIVHKTASALLLCHVDHHDAAYAWAERRRIERHPTTGAAQLVEIRERVPEYASPREREPLYETEDVPQAKFLPPLFLALSHDDILGVGVPTDWVEAVHNATEESIFDLADHLPAEAVEALLDYVATGILRLATTAGADADPFDHPDAQRRFRVLENVEELQRALDYPWEKWTVFLHPAQRQLVEKDYGGPVRISGSAGTGKTIVALHRAVFLARRHPQARVLLTTFSQALANALKVKLGRLVGNEPEVAARIIVQSVNGIGSDLYAQAFGPPAIAAASLIQSLLAQATEAEQRFSPKFLWGEWSEVVDAWQLRTWDDYRDVARLGRKTRIGGKQREALWTIFTRVRAALAARCSMTWADLFGQLAGRLAGHPAFDFAVIDEAQDLGVAEMRFLSALVDGRPDGLCFAGDLGQRIFQQPFSWKSLGVAALHHAAQGLPRLPGRVGPPSDGLGHPCADSLCPACLCVAHPLPGMRRSAGVAKPGDHRLPVRHLARQNPDGRSRSDRAHGGQGNRQGC